MQAPNPFAGLVFSEINVSSLRAAQTGTPKRIKWEGAHEDFITLVNLVSTTPELILFRFKKTEQNFINLFTCKENNLLFPAKRLDKFAAHTSAEVTDIRNFIEGVDLNAAHYNELRKLCCDHADVVESILLTCYSEYMRHEQGLPENFAFFEKKYQPVANVKQDFEELMEKIEDEKKEPQEDVMKMGENGRMYDTYYMDSFLYDEEDFGDEDYEDLVKRYITLQQYADAQQNLLAASRQFLKKLKSKKQLPSMDFQGFVKRKLAFRARRNSAIVKLAFTMAAVMEKIWKQLSKEEKEKVARAKQADEKVDEAFRSLTLDEQIDVEFDYMLETGDTFFTPFVGANTYANYLKTGKEKAETVVVNPYFFIRTDTLHGTQVEELPVKQYLDNPRALDNRDQEERKRVKSKLSKKKLPDGGDRYYIYDGFSPFHVAMAQKYSVHRIASHVERFGTLPLNEYFVQEIKSVDMITLRTAYATFKKSEAEGKTKPNRNFLINLIDSLDRKDFV